MLQNIQLGIERVAAVHVDVVLALPEKGLLPLHYLEALRDHIMLVEHVNVALLEVVADDRNQMHWFGQVACA